MGFPKEGFRFKIPKTSFGIPARSSLSFSSSSLLSLLALAVKRGFPALTRSSSHQDAYLCPVSPLLNHWLFFWTLTAHLMCSSLDRTKTPVRDTASCPPSIFLVGIFLFILDAPSQILIHLAMVASRLQRCAGKKRQHFTLVH